MSRSLLRAAALASPVIWFASHSIQFALAPLTCLWHSNAVLWMATAVALLLVAGSGLAAWTEWRAASMPPWLAMSGIALSGGFFLVVAAQAIPVLMLAGCE